MDSPDLGVRRLLGIWPIIVLVAAFALGWAGTSLLPGPGRSGAITIGQESPAS